MTSIQFIDLAAQQTRIKSQIDAALQRTLAHGIYIMGPEIPELEARLGAYAGARHVVACSNGTDALALCLMVQDVQPGQAVFCPSFTFAATAEVIAWLGAVPFFVDVDESTFNIAPSSLKDAIAEARLLGLLPGAVICVDLFGRPAEYAELETIAAETGIPVICDSAQSFGASYRGRSVGTIGDATSTSFFPAKPLGCYGDGGAVFLESEEKANLVRSLIVHGKGVDKYDNVRVGINGRLDSLQAGILIEKLHIFKDETDARIRIASEYNAGLHDVVIVPEISMSAMSVWAQYTVRVPAYARSDIQAELKKNGIPTAIYYPKPLHTQLPYLGYPSQSNGLPVTTRLCREVLSLPMHPYLTEDAQQHIVNSIRQIVADLDITPLSRRESSEC